MEPQGILIPLRLPVSPRPFTGAGVVRAEGLEPQDLRRWNLKPVRCQFRHARTWWARPDSNREPDRYKRPALTIELQALGTKTVPA
jgi:hypothetical protein